MKDVETASGRKKALLISGVAWNATYQRHHLNAKIISSFGFDVDFLESCKSSALTWRNILRLIKRSRNVSSESINEVPSGVNIVTANLLPPHGFTSVVLNFFLFNFYLKKKLAKEYDLILFYVPIDLVFFVQSFKPHRIVYDCVRAFSKWGGYHNSLYRNERYLAGLADFVMCDSFYIKNVYAPGLKVGLDVEHILPPLEFKNKLTASLPSEIRRIGYFGSISEHVDIDVFIRLLDAGYEVLFWGIDDEKILATGVKKFGYISDQGELFESLSANCDAIIIPYKNNLDGVYPAKLSLSLLTDLPVFCSDFYDSRSLSDIVYVYSCHDDLFSQIKMYSPDAHAVRNKKVASFRDELDYSNYANRLRGVFHGD